MGFFARWRSSIGVPHAALDTSADQAIALIDEGNRLEESGDFASARQRYEQAVRIAPELPRAHLNHGNALLQRGDASQALAAYARALALDPRHAGAHFNTGNAQLQLGRRDDALRAYLKAAELDPGFVDAMVAAGAVLDDLGRTQEAIDTYQRALALAPDYAEVHSNLGNALRSAGRFEDAVHAHRRSLALNPRLGASHNNLGNALKDLGRLEAAEAAYREALALNPGDFDARSNLLFSLNYRAGLAPAQLLGEARAYGACAARVATPFTAWQGSRDADRCLRIGLVSGDLRVHPVGYFLESALTALAAQSRGRLQLLAYPTVPSRDALAARLRSACDAWQPLHGLTDAHAARLIHSDAIDILIDLSGHSGHTRLPVFAWKPSPVQVAWLGYFATTGVAAIDHVIADPWTVPPGREADFSEAIWRLPETRLCFTAPEVDLPVSALPSLVDGCITFGCFNNLTKVSDAVIALWARVLHAVPASRLLLKAPQLAEASQRTRIVERFEASGIDAGRLTLQGLSPRSDYLRAHDRVDIALDPFPFTGGTTTMEALWMGVPVLSLAGDSMVARQGVGLLMNAGLPGWVAADAEAYVRLAATHAADRPRLAGLRAGLRAQLQASPVMDAARFAGHFEAALRGMWRAHCDAG